MFSHIFESLARRIDKVVTSSSLNRCILAVHWPLEMHLANHAQEQILTAEAEEYVCELFPPFVRCSP